VFRNPVLVFIGGILFLQVAGVGEQHMAKGPRGVRGVDGTPESVLDQKRHVPGVVNVGMRQEDGINRLWFDRERAPVSPAQGTVLGGA